MNSDNRGIQGGEPGLSLNGPSHNVQYEVFVGHARVHVEGQNVGDAIRRARECLCRDMPRLWDVIQALRTEQFRVCPLDGQASS